MPDFYTCMVQVGSQKYRSFKFLLSYLVCSQIGSKLPVDHHHFGYNTKLPHKKTLPHSRPHKMAYVYPDTSVCNAHSLEVL